MNASVQRTWSVSRVPAISAWRGFNTVLDFVFYNIGGLSESERESFTTHLTAEGGIVVAHPSGVKQEIALRTYEEFVQQQLNASVRGERVDTIVVAGVGSSVLGTAALARDVADYFGRPVAGVISGLGMADMLTEALGGWFVLGIRNALRDMLARTFDGLGLKDHVRDQDSHDEMRRDFAKHGADPERFLYESPDATALLFCLSKLGSKIRYLVGHSKGNYMIESALAGLERLRQASPSGKAFRWSGKVVTLGAVVWFDRNPAEVQQVIGGLDGFGMMNSRPGLPRIVMPGRWHSLNSGLRGFLSVAEALQLAGVERTGSVRAHATRSTGLRDGNWKPGHTARARGDGLKVKTRRRSAHRGFVKN